MTNRPPAVEAAIENFEDTFNGVHHTPWEQIKTYIRQLEQALATPQPTAEVSSTASPCAIRYGWDGYGYKYIDNGSGSDWCTRHCDGEPLYDKSALDAHALTAGEKVKQSCEIAAFDAVRSVVISATGGTELPDHVALSIRALDVAAIIK